MPSDTHRADERRFLDERGSNATLAPNGLNPATIMEKAVRERIVDSYFWKEQCFGLNEADIVDRVVEHVNFIGGIYGDTQKPSPFLCLAFKLLQLAPGDDVLGVYLGYGGEKFKYLRALACFYVRLTRRAESVYKVLEGFLVDRRKLRRRGRGGQGGARVTFVDEFVDELLTKERVCATSLWQMPRREILEDLEVLEPRVSPLGDIEDLLDEDEEGEKNGEDREDDGGSDGGRDRDEDERGGGSDGEEGEIRGNRRRRSPSSAGYDSERDHRRRSSRGRSSGGDRMDVDRERRGDRGESGSRRRRSRSRSESR
ncbi:PRP38 family-domain-containing protein [Xylaria sp. FL0933]|nr:PRP38 family-domain-containing protein [Xylaria sp. FL0933]